MSISFYISLTSLSIFFIFSLTMLIGFLAMRGKLPTENILPDFYLLKTLTAWDTVALISLSPTLFSSAIVL